MYRGLDKEPETYRSGLPSSSQQAPVSVITAYLFHLSAFFSPCLEIRASRQRVKASQTLGRVPTSPRDTGHKPHPCLPALRKAVMASSTAVLRSKAPAWAPCHNMANSPETW